MLSRVINNAYTESLIDIQVKNSAGEDMREGVWVSPTEVHELSGSRGTANFLLKWVRDAKHEASLNVQQIKGVTRSFTSEDVDYVPIVAFECRGMEPIDWMPDAGFIIKSNSGQIFTDVDLSEKEWADYDEKSGDSVSVMNLEWIFRVHREK